MHSTIHKILFSFLGGLFLFCSTAFAQKPEYKNNTILIGGKEIAKVVKIKDKENLGLTSTYELHSNGGTKLIIATVATEFKEPMNDNSNYYYRFTFLPTNQVAIFSLAKLGTEKSFAKLIGESSIVAGEELDAAKVDELIARRSKNPKVEVHYDLVKRNMMMPVLIKENNVVQGITPIGKFIDVTDNRDYDTYKFNLPDGMTVATVKFTGGNNAKTAQFYTFKDSRSWNVSIADAHEIKMTMRSEGTDRNYIVLKRIAEWLVKNEYL